MSNISVIQIFRKSPGNPSEIILENAKFLANQEVEYFVYDNLSDFEILKKVGASPLKESKIKYFRKGFISLKTSFIESGLLSSGEKIIYLKENDVLNMSNVEILEATRPNILKKDFRRITQIKNNNFKFDLFNLLIKEKKTFLEKIKIILS